MNVNLFFLNQRIIIVYPNKENMIIVPITKKLEIIINIHVCLISLMNFNNKENRKEKLFLPNQSINIVYPKEVNMIVMPNTKKNRDYYKYPSLSQFTDEF